jgi:predicted peptidase
MFVVMVMSVRSSKAVHTETVSKEINITTNTTTTTTTTTNNHHIINSGQLLSNNLKNISCIDNSQLKIIKNSDKNSHCCTIDKTIKQIIPITAADTPTTILSPSALTAAAQNSAQPNPNKFLLTELNNYRSRQQPPTIQVSIEQTNKHAIHE